MAVSRAENEAAPDDEAGLIEIDTLIQSAHEVKEVFASADHAEVAQENEAALAAFQAAARQFRRAARNTLRYEDLTTGVGSLEGPADAPTEAPVEAEVADTDESPSTTQ
jgi:hypothetical protein